jgi:hypothetical protein
MFTSSAAPPTRRRKQLHHPARPPFGRPDPGTRRIRRWGPRRLPTHFLRCVRVRSAQQHQQLERAPRERDKNELATPTEWTRRHDQFRASLSKPRRSEGAHWQTRVSAEPAVLEGGPAEVEQGDCGRACHQRSRSAQPREHVLFKLDRRSGMRAALWAVSVAIWSSTASNGC